MLNSGGVHVLITILSRFPAQSFLVDKICKLLHTLLKFERTLTDEFGWPVYRQWRVLSWLRVVVVLFVSIMETTERLVARQIISAGGEQALRAAFHEQTAVDTKLASRLQAIMQEKLMTAH